MKHINEEHKWRILQLQKSEKERERNRRMCNEMNTKKEKRETEKLKRSCQAK